ncbi:MAG: pirin family protein [Actinomycetes bacterium]
MSSEITLDPRLVKLTVRSGIAIRRTLPHREIKSIGAWCFVDHYGPTNQLEAMSVAAHPHTGLQTASWLFSGEIEHRDSLQHVQIINPGELNLMSAGAGIAHSELSINASSDLHGVQLWIALPDEKRNMAPEFNHYAKLPIFEHDGATIRVFVGEILGNRSPAKVFSELVGAEINIEPDVIFSLPLQNNFEYGFLVDGGEVLINGTPVPEGSLRYLPTTIDSVSIETRSPARILMLGGVPFPEEIIMWWNFIGRTHEEIIQMRQDWESGSSRFPTFADGLGERIPAPVMPNIRLAPRGRRKPLR